jgi:hypothetical protein
MAKRKRQRKNAIYGMSDSDKAKIVAIARHTLPSLILAVLAIEYRSYPRKSEAGSVEQEFWVKVSKSTSNLASGMDKWVNEWQDEEEP